jgi:hypothetical protein
LPVITGTIIGCTVVSREPLQSRHALMSQIRTVELEILLNIGPLSIVNQIGLIRSRPCEVVLNINYSFVFGPRGRILLPTAGRLLHFLAAVPIKLKANRVQYTLRNGSAAALPPAREEAIEP